MASRHGYSAFLIAASLLMLSGLSVLYLATDGSDATEGDYGNYHWVMDDGKNLTVTGHGDLNTFQSGWNGLVTLTLVPDGAVNIGDYVLQDCGSLTTVTINGFVESIGEGVFYDCGSLTTVSIDGSVGSIGVGALENCDSLTTVTIDGPVGSIGGFAFSGCDSLSELTIAGPVTEIDGYAFNGCTNLKTVNIACNDTEITAGSSAKGGIAKNADTVNHVHRYSATYGWADDGSSCTVHIVCANTSDHNHDENATVTSTVKVQPTAIVPGTTEYSVSGTYDGFAYADTKDIQDIPPVTEGTQGDFRWTMDGTSLTVTGHGTLGFDLLWVGLTSLTLIPDGGTVNIGDGALGYCGSLTTVTINGSVGSIGDGAFQYCTSLSEMTIAGPITNVSGSSFSHCDNLKTVNIACNDTEITAGSSAKGGIAKNADTVNHVHRYSATYG